MRIVVTAAPPSIPAVHIALGGARLPRADGALLSADSPEAALAAARAARRRRTDWVVHGLVAASEHDCVAFVIQLARRTRGRVWVALDPTRGAHIRVAGHLMRAGCDADPSWVSL